MANWKIRDIVPPEKRKAESKKKEPEAKAEPQKKKAGKGKGNKFLLTRGVPALIVLAAGGVGVLHFFFAKAEVQIWPITRELSAEAAVEGRVEDVAFDKTQEILPMETLEGEKEATRMFSASSTTVKENRASGTLRVFNANSASPMNLLANTRFVSETGQMFRSPSSITIPGMTGQEPGFVDVEVVAAEPGQEYNIGPASFSLPGLSGSPLFTKIYAKSTVSMSGGSEREVAVVSREDIEQAKNELEQELKAQLVDVLLSRVPGHMVATPETVVIEVTESRSLVEAGSELEQFGVIVSLKGTAYLFSQDQVHELATRHLEDLLDEGERIENGRTKVGFQDIALDPQTGNVNLKMQIEALAYRHLNATEMKILLRGKSEAQAKDLLFQHEAVERSSVSFWPFWISSIPEDVDKLEVEVLIDPAPNL